MSCWSLISAPLVLCFDQVPYNKKRGDNSYLSSYNSLTVLLTNTKYHYFWIIIHYAFMHVLLLYLILPSFLHTSHHLMTFPPLNLGWTKRRFSTHIGCPLPSLLLITILQFPMFKVDFTLLLSWLLLALVCGWRWPPHSQPCDDIRYNLDNAQFLRSNYIDFYWCLDL